MGLEVGGGGTEEKEKEKIPLCESIGHRPLRGRCPKSRKKINIFISVIIFVKRDLNQD